MRISISTYSSLRACSNVPARVDTCETDTRLSGRSGRPDEDKMCYQRFELVSHGSHELGVFRFILFLQGYYRLDGGGEQGS
jgi:hypothetical protein